MTPLKKALDAADKDVCNLFSKEGEVTMTWLCQTTDNLMIIPAPPYKVDKEALTTAVKDVFKELGVIRYILVCEAWMIKRDETQNLPTRNLKNEPDSVEVVFLVGEDKNTHEQVACLRQIHRPPNGPAILGDREELPSGGLDGLFASMFIESTTRH